MLKSSWISLVRTSSKLLGASQCSPPVEIPHQDGGLPAGVTAWEISEKSPAWVQSHPTPLVNHLHHRCTERPAQYRLVEGWKIGQFIYTSNNMWIMHDSCAVYMQFVYLITLIPSLFLFLRQKRTDLNHLSRYVSNKHENIPSNVPQLLENDRNECTKCSHWSLPKSQTT